MLEREGSNGVGKTLGYYIKNLDEIFVTSLLLPILYKVDGDARLLDKIDLRNCTDFPITTFPATSFNHRPILFIGDRMYLEQHFNRRLGKDDYLSKSPLALLFDTLSHTVAASDFKYPPIRKEMDYFEGKTVGVELNFSHECDGKRILYSFGSDEQIYEVSLEGQLRRKIPAKSRYVGDVSQLNIPPANMKAALRKMSEVPLYGNLIYDKYRDVYYRVAYPETEVDPSLDGGDLWQFGRSRFSVMILDKDLQVIGETLLPDNIYISTLMFIREDGLYISDSHYLKPDFNEDVLGFRRFELREE